MIDLTEQLIAPPSLLKKLDIKTSGKEEITEGRIKDALPNLRKQFSFFRQYPDVFLDMIKDPNEKFEFYFYQRFFLRCAMRHRYMYATFPRAYSKSFLSIMALYLRCIFYPNSKLFIVSGGKEQSAKIASEKIEELWKFFPSLRNEIIEGSNDPEVIEFVKANNIGFIFNLAKETLGMMR